MNEVWTYQDIADRYKYNVGHVRDRLMKKPGAPKQIAPDRYDSEEVTRFLASLPGRSRRGCSKSSHDADHASQTSGKDPVN